MWVGLHSRARPLRQLLRLLLHRLLLLRLIEGALELQLLLEAGRQRLQGGIERVWCVRVRVLEGSA